MPWGARRGDLSVRPPLGTGVAGRGGLPRRRAEHGRGPAPKFFPSQVPWLPLGACLLLVSAVPSPLPAQQEVEEVVGVRFVGNRVFSDRALANAILTRPRECSSPLLALFCVAGADFATRRHPFSPREFTRDEARLRLFYYQRGYREAVVDPSVERPAPGQVRVTFRIQEGEPVRVAALRVEGVEEVETPSLLRNLPLRPGDPLNALALEATRDTLLQRLRNDGYAHAEVLQSFFIPRDSPRAAQVTFQVYPGSRARFGPLAIVGNSSVPAVVVRRMLPFRPGDLYRQDLRFAGLRNLYNLEIFSFADILPDTTFVPDSIVPLTVQLVEGPVHRVRTGAGFSSAECLGAEVRWASRNFFGGLRRLQLTGRVSNALASRLHESLCRQAGTGPYGDLDWHLSAEFSQPWLLSPRNSFTASLFWERQSFPDEFIRNARGLNAALTHTMSPATPFTVAFRPQVSSLAAADVFFCSNYLVCDPADIRILQRANRLAPVGITLSRDRRDQVLSATRGYRAVVDLEQAAAWTGSDYRYTRILLEGSWYAAPTGSWILATRLRGGRVGAGGFRGLAGERGGGGIVHPEKRFFAGGANSVRGFAQNRLGPRVLEVRAERLLTPGSGGEPPVCALEEILARACDASPLPDEAFDPRPTGGTSLLEGSVEVRLPVRGSPWEGAVFVDFGQVWGEDRRVSLGGLEVTPGLGVRYVSPIGPIRVDLAYRFAGAEDLKVVVSGVGPERALSLLEPRVRYGALPSWSWQRFQLHLSIGQAF